MLHTVLLLRRLEGEAPPIRALGQGLFDRFCRDMDDSMRELGVGDLAVPRNMHRIGEAFYGRQAAYRDALDAARSNPSWGRMTRPERRPGRPWSVPLALSDVPESGRHLNLFADRQTRDAVAEHAGLTALTRLEASFDVMPHGRGGLHVVGRVSATVGQTCVVTLEPLKNEIDEAIDLVFAPAEAPPIGGAEVDLSAADAPEPLMGGGVDLGEIATEFLILGLDPYPRKPDAIFQSAPAGEDSANPFAALAALKKHHRRGER